MDTQHRLEGRGVEGQSGNEEAVEPLEIQALTVGSMNTGLLVSLAGLDVPYQIS